MQEITDDFMNQMLQQAKTYTLLVFKPGPNAAGANVQPILWEHARHNFKLREEGLLSIVCPVRQESEIAGIGIFTADAETVHDRMKEDPAIQAGVLTYELLPVMSFPGDKLPG